MRLHERGANRAMIFDTIFIKLMNISIRSQYNRHFL